MTYLRAQFVPRVWRVFLEERPKVDGTFKPARAASGFKVRNPASIAVQRERSGIGNRGSSGYARRFYDAGGSEGIPANGAAAKSGWTIGPAKADAFVLWLIFYLEPLDCRLDGPMITLSPVTPAENPGGQDCCSSEGVGRREHTWGSRANLERSAEARGRKFFPSGKTLFGRWRQLRSQTRWPQR